MKRRNIFYGVLLLIVFVNLPFFNFLFQEAYSYQNRDGSFTYNEESGKGKSYWGCQRKYGYFLCQHPEKDTGDNRLYRTFTIKPFYFWQWGQYLFHSDRFALPYLDTTQRK